MIGTEIRHVFDWYVDHLDQSPRFNIFSMTLDQAMQASDRWHEELANQTSTKTFTKIKKENGQIVDPNVVFIFDKEIIDRSDLSEKYVGWMIVKITEESDFDIEYFYKVIKQLVSDKNDTKKINKLFQGNVQKILKSLLFLIHYN
jgi:hypothetical protein